jgi:hypothetical protein
VGAAMTVIMTTKKRKMAFPKLRYVQCGGYGFLHDPFSFSDRPALSFLAACARGPGCPPWHPTRRSS